MYVDDAELAAIVAREKAVVDKARNPIVVTDENGTIVEVNAMTCSVFGYTNVGLWHMLSV